MHSSLTAVIARAHAAIFKSSTVPILQEQAVTAAPDVTAPPAHEQPTTRPTTLAPPRVLAVFSSAEDVRQGVKLTKGAKRLWEVLHRLAVDTARARSYSHTVSQVVMHVSQEILAEALGVHRVTVWRWATELEQLGLVASRQHFTTATECGNRVTRVDGTLYAVSLKAGYRASLRREDLKHEYRDLDAAKRTGNTAFKVLQQSRTHKDVDWYDVLRAWAVNPDSDHYHPLNTDCCSVPDGLAAVARALPLLAEAHATKRTALVGILASGIAHGINDTHSRRYWCKAIWEAYEAELEGRGGLQVLAAQLCRLAADLTEGAPWKNAGAVLAARLRAA